MKKIFALAAILVFSLLAPLSASAALDGGFFTVEVPEGWELDPGESTETSGILVSPDRSVVFSITKIPSPATSLSDLAEQFADIHSSEDLTRMEGEGEAWEYTGTVSGKPLYAQLFSLEGGACGYITVIGDYGNETTTEIFNSIEYK